MTTSWKKKEEFSIFGKENYNKCKSDNGSVSKNGFTNFVNFVKMGLGKIIYGVEAPFIYTDRAITFVLLNSLYLNTNCVKIKDINTLAHIQSDPNVLNGNTNDVQSKINQTITDISNNILLIEKENNNIKNYEKKKNSLIQEKSNYTQNVKAVSNEAGSLFKQDDTEKNYDKQIDEQENLIFESNKNINKYNEKIEDLNRSLSDYNTRLYAINVTKESLNEPPHCKKLRKEVLDVSIMIKKQIYNILGIPLVLFIAYNIFFILCCKAPYGNGTEPVIPDVEKTITGKQGIAEDFVSGSYYMIEIVLNAVLYPFSILNDIFVYLRSCFVDDNDSILASSNPIKSNLTSINETYPLIIFLFLCFYIFTLYNSGLYSQLWNITIYGTPTKTPVRNTDGSININDSQTAAGTTEDNYNYAAMISSFVIVFVWIGFVFRFPGIIVKTLINTSGSMLLAIAAFIVFLLCTIALASKVPLFIMIYLLIVSCFSFLYQPTDKNYFFFEWYFKDFISHISDMMNAFNREYMEKKDGKFTNNDILNRTINSSGMFGIVNDVIYKAIYKQNMVGDKDCEQLGFFQKLYNSIQKGIFSNIFEILFILILLYGIFDYMKGYAYASELPLVLMILVILNIFFIACSGLSIYVKHLIRNDILDSKYGELLKKEASEKNGGMDNMASDETPKPPPP
jgi:flagellar biosynthesis chaperone FliJ